MRHLLGACLLAGLAYCSGATASEEEAVFKEWLTHKGGYVRVEKCADSDLLCGRISALSPDHEGPPPLDVNNKNPELQSRPLLGLQLFSDFEYKGKGHWKNGSIYNTDDGKTYDSKLKLLENGDLKVSGCVLFVCQSYVWTPAPAGDVAAGE